MEISLFVRILQNYAAFLIVTAARILAQTKFRTDGLQALRTSASTTLDDLTQNQRPERRQECTATFAIRAAQLFDPQSPIEKEARLFEAPTVMAGSCVIAIHRTGVSIGGRIKTGLFGFRSPHSVRVSTSAILGPGGVVSIGDAHQRLQVGMSLVQVYMRMVYGDPREIERMGRKLAEIRQGRMNIAVWKTWLGHRDLYWEKRLEKTREGRKGDVVIVDGYRVCV